MIFSDAASAVLDFLQHHDDAASVRACLVDEDYIKEAGSYVSDDLSSAESQRLATSALTKVLGITVQDGGEEPVVGNSLVRQTVVVRVLDRRRGYMNIREARNVIRQVLNVPLRFTLENGKRGFLELRFSGRSGYQYSGDFYVDYETIEYVADLEILAGE